MREGRHRQRANGRPRVHFGEHKARREWSPPLTTQDTMSGISEKNPRIAKHEARVWTPPNQEERGASHVKPQHSPACRRAGRGRCRCQSTEQHGQVLSRERGNRHANAGASEVLTNWATRARATTSGRLRAKLDSGENPRHRRSAFRVWQHARKTRARLRSVRREATIPTQERSWCMSGPTSATTKEKTRTR
jgi:hypothetical protein